MTPRASGESSTHLVQKATKHCLDMKPPLYSQKTVDDFANGLLVNFNQDNKEQLSGPDFGFLDHDQSLPTPNGSNHFNCRNIIDGLYPFTTSERSAPLTSQYRSMQKDQCKLQELSSGIQQNDHLTAHKKSQRNIFVLDTDDLSQMTRNQKVERDAVTVCS